MGRAPTVPAELTQGPFTLRDARRSGLDRWHLRGISWRRLGNDSYIWTGLADTPLLRLEAARRRLPTTAAFSGLTAAWLHGLDVQPCDPIEAIVPRRAGVSARAGILLRRAVAIDGGVVVRRGMPATS